MRELRGRNALVTGAAGGLGGFIARALAAEGVSLMLSDLPEAPPDDLIEELRGRGVSVEWVPADLSDRAEAEGLVGRAEETLGPLDILVNNAGLEFGGEFEKVTPAQIDALLRVNLLAPMITTHTAIPRMRERGGGHIVNIASLAGKSVAPYLATYSGSKHGVVGFTHSLRAELGSEPVGFSVICPGFISQVGMFGRLAGQPEPPPGLRVLPPERVGEAVVRAIRDNRAEIVVASPAVQPLIALSALAPGIASRLGRNRRAREFAEEFARAREATPKTAAEVRAETLD